MTLRDESPAPIAPVLTPRRCHVGHVWMSDAVYLALEAEAQRRRKHPDALLAEIAESIISENLFKALLDR